MCALLFAYSFMKKECGKRDIFSLKNGVPYSGGVAILSEIKRSMKCPPVES